MSGEDITVRSSDGGEFDCYLVEPVDRLKKVPTIVLASAIHGVDADIRAIADEFASHGYLAAAPDLFWKTETPGPLARDDARAKPRGQPRLERLKAGEGVMADTLTMVKKHPLSNGKAASMGFCYGGPFAVLGPLRLGYDAGIGCHSTQMGDFTKEAAEVRKPVCLVWGDKDFAAPAEVLDAYRALAAKNDFIDLHVFPGVQHGYMMRGNPEAFDATTRDFSMIRAYAILEKLRTAG
jgi:carboxymethylenebutenolidase